MSTGATGLLIVEDDIALRKQMRWALADLEPQTASDFESALSQARRFRPPVITLDLGLPPHADSTHEGFRTLSALLEILPDSKIIVLTGQADRANALAAIDLGAFDFCTKPFDPDVLSLIIERAARIHSLQQENHQTREAEVAGALDGLITRDPEMLRIGRLVQRIAPMPVSVMLLGESGTGKEVLARALHANSPRKNERFIALNCAAIPENLLESELFGYERGAFTGAVKATPGKIELAHGGSLFLDEIGDLPSPLQAKLLRFLQERCIERVGGRETIPVDVRVISATHRDLKEMSQSGTFREDLYYRLAELVIEIPPLRKRIDDVTLLAHAFLRRHSATLRGGSTPTLRPDAIEAIQSHPWPGNVRELENAVKRAVMMCEGDFVSAEDLGLGTPDSKCDLDSFTLRRAREDAEKTAIIKALNRADGNLAKAADTLGVSRPTLYDLIRRLGIRDEIEMPAADF